MIKLLSYLPLLLHNRLLRLLCHSQCNASQLPHPSVQGGHQLLLGLLHKDLSFTTSPWTSWTTTSLGTLPQAELLPALKTNRMSSPVTLHLHNDLAGSDLDEQLPQDLRRMAPPVPSLDLALLALVA